MAPKGNGFVQSGGAHETILVALFLLTEQIVTRARHQFLRDFSRPTEIGQYQTVVILHRHVNRLKSAD